MRRRLSVLLLLALCALPAASCSSDGTGPVPTNQTFAARYQLEAVDGQPLPVVWSETDTTALHVSRSLLSADADGTYSFGWDGWYAHKATGDVLRRLRLAINLGRYTLEGHTVRFESGHGGVGPEQTSESTLSGTIRSREEVHVQMTVDGRVRTLTYRRVCEPDVSTQDCLNRLSSTGASSGKALLTRSVRP